MNGEYGTSTCEFSIEGMHCEQCVEKIEESLSGVEGMEYFDVRIGHVRVSYLSQLIDKENIVGLIKAVGYSVLRHAPKKSVWNRFIDRMIQNNENTFGTAKLDCCSIISDQEKREQMKRIVK